MTAFLTPHYLSPAKRFCDRIEERYHVKLEGVSTDYVMPPDYSPEALEALLLQPRYATNARVMVERTSLFSRSRNRYVAASRWPHETDTVEARRKELLPIANQLLELNPALKPDVPEGNFNDYNISQIFHFIWGCVCSFNRDDLVGFAVKTQWNGVEKAEDYARWRALKHSIEKQCGEQMEWIPRMSTLETIAATFEKHKGAICNDWRTRLHPDAVAAWMI